MEIKTIHCSFGVQFLFLSILWSESAKRRRLINMYWIEDDSEAVEECEELYSIIPIIDESDLSDLEEDQLADLDDEEEDIDF